MRAGISAFQVGG